MQIWSSEPGGGRVYPIEDDPAYVRLDSNNGVLVTELIGVETLLFNGPDAKVNIEKWAAWVKEQNWTEYYDPGSEPYDSLVKCFGPLLSHWESK